MEEAGTGSNDWCTIESDPGVFTELLEDLGVKGVELQELWSLDDESLLSEIGNSQVYGLIFLFQWIGKKEGESDEGSSKPQPLSESEIPDDLFFAHQVTTNACATQAILSVLFNNAGTDDRPINADNLGSVLSEFQSFTKDFPPSLKGVAISSVRTISQLLLRHC